MPISLFLATACFIAAVFLFGMFCGLRMAPRPRPLQLPVLEDYSNVINMDDHKKKEHTIDIIA